MLEEYWEPLREESRETARSNVRTEENHVFPQFMLPGNTATSPMIDVIHRQFHRDLNQFLRQQINEFGQHMRPQRNNAGEMIRQNWSEYSRWSAMREFYNRFGKIYRDEAELFFRSFPEQSFCGK